MDALAPFPVPGDMPMPSVSKFVPALRRKRLAILLSAAALCTTIGACGNDDADTSKAASTDSDTSATVPLNASAHESQTAQAGTAPSTTPALTIQTPPLPASNTGAALSSTAPEPLATPVIHTVD
jgi:hypothetical protein